jgi:hypothetical protein
MLRKMAGAFAWVACVAATCVVAGCEGKAEGDSCGSQNDCRPDLTCQPITGRTGDYCCPSPADMSSKGNCQALTPDGGWTP